MTMVRDRGQMGGHLICTLPVLELTDAFCLFTCEGWFTDTRHLQDWIEMVGGIHFVFQGDKQRKNLQFPL